MERPPLEIFRNYEMRLRQAGFEILFKCAQQAQCGYQYQAVVYPSERRFKRPKARSSGFDLPQDIHYLAAKMPSASGNVYVSLLIGFERSVEKGPVALLEVIESKETDTGIEVYQALKRFQLSGATAVAENVTLKRDRVEMTFNGTFYFEQPVAGRVHGAVFFGTGKLRAELPPSGFERDHVRRMLNADVVESDFRQAVLRFTDDTFDYIGKNLSPSSAPIPEAEKLAAKFERKLLEETGTNLSARLAVSLLNQESPGFFLEQFDKGKRGRFTFLLDHQGRLPVEAFGLNDGTKGLIVGHGEFANDIWVAFYSLADYERASVTYSDLFDLVAIQHYAMQVDVLRPKKVLKLEVRMDLESAVNGLRAIPMVISESLSSYKSARLKKAMRLKMVRFANGGGLDAVQEDWEGGLTLFLATSRAAGEKFSVVMNLEGDFMLDASESDMPACYYPHGTSHWYPRHGYLKPSTFDLTFRHRKNHRVASVGVRVREEMAPGSDSEMVTQWKMDTPRQDGHVWRRPP